MQQYTVKGMMCSACSAKVEKTVSGLKGVTSCSVNLLTENMTVEGNVSPDSVIEAVDEAGFKAELVSGTYIQEKKENLDKEKNTIRKRLFSSLFLLVILMYFSMGSMINLPQPKNDLITGAVQCTLSLLILVINRRFFISGFKAVKNKSANMDTLVSLGSGVSFIYSLYNLAVNHEINNLYFDSAAMILTLVTIGKLIESGAKKKTTSAIDRLVNLTPKTATVIRDGKEETINASDIVKDDIFTVKPGETITADGIVISGSASIDESALTGESIPVLKEKDSLVYAGTINNDGFITCKSSGNISTTMLSKIISLVNEATARKAPVQRIADKVAGIFVPVVIGIAIITFAVRFILTKDIAFAIKGAVSVLVISCPCSLGLATPVAVTTGSGTAAKKGILFKSAAILEETSEASAVVFDKTGTLTEGRPTVTDIFSVDSDNNLLLKLLYSVEIKSEHPISKAVCEYCKDNNIISADISEFRNIPGQGIEGTLNGSTIKAGNTDFIKLSTDEVILSDIIKLQDAGKTVICISYSDKFIGYVAVADKLKEDASEVVLKLKNLGLNVYMVTGDNERTARSIAKEAGIDNVFASVFPDKKSEIISEIKKKGKTIMVGDGINDSPALVQADVGIAMGSGTDIAIDSADIVITGNGISNIYKAIDLSRSVMKNIKENLFWAFFYNCIGIPLAAGAFIPLGIELNPMICAAAMSLSSLCVVTNALRLRKK